MIGAIGGSRGKNDPKRKQLNRLATIASWSSHARAKRLSNRCAKIKKLAELNVNKDIA